MIFKIWPKTGAAVNVDGQNYLNDPNKQKYTVAQGNKDLEEGIDNFVGV